MDKKSFQNPERWRLCCYELAIPVSDGTRLERAVRTLWAQPRLRGVWRERSDFPDGAVGVADAWAGYGLLSLSAGMEVGCEVVLIPDVDCDWLKLGIPYGMLEEVFDTERPLSDHLGPWREMLDQALVAVAEGIYHEVPFSLALVGEEVSGSTDEGRFRREDLERGGCLLSPEFSARSGVEGRGIPLPSGLTWFPRPPAARGRTAAV